MAVRYRKGKWYKQMDDLHTLEDQCGCCWKLYCCWELYEPEKELDLDESLETVKHFIWNQATVKRSDNYLVPRTDEEIEEFIMRRYDDVLSISQGLKKDDNVIEAIYDVISPFFEDGEEQDEEVYDFRYNPYRCFSI